jgi:hypothetical protein
LKREKRISFINTLNTLPWQVILFITLPKLTIMKKVFYWMGTLFIFSLAACENTGGATGERQDSRDTTKKTVMLTEGDSAFIVGWNGFKNVDTGFKSMFDQPIKSSLAQKCIDEYLSHFGNGPANTTDVQFTQYVRFDTGKFKDWTIIDKVFDRSTMIIIELGIYTREVFEALRDDEDVKNDIPESSIGKITVFISPYKSKGVRATRVDGSEIDPFNLGSLHP